MKLQQQIDRLTARRASEWHQRLEGGGEQDRKAFVAWLKQSPLHVREYLETMYTDRVLAHLDPTREEDVAALLTWAAPVVALEAGASRDVRPHEPMTNSATDARPAAGSRRRTMGLAVAATLLCAVAAPLLYQQLAGPQRFTTGIGEQRTLELSDASVVTLNADTRIVIRFARDSRHVELLRGEALFEVARDAARPFRVHTPTAVIRVVGTRFNVYERPEGAHVSVLEGRVQVMAQPPSIQDESDTPLAENLGAGEQVQVEADGTLRHDPGADLARTIAWRERRLIFSDTPLEEVVREFNRYNRTTRLVIEGVPPGSHHYNGIFEASDPQSLAALLAREPDLTVAHDEGVIRIRPR